MERRRQRSRNIEDATRFQLEQVINDFDLRSCLLMDEAGKVLGTAGETSRLEKIVPKIPVLARESSPDEEGVYVCEFRADGHKLFIAAEGDLATFVTVGAYRALLGIRRIHANAA